MSVYLEGANWRDRILNHYPPASDGERYYKIVKPDGTVVAEAAKLELLNTVLPGNEGTPVNAGNMNSILAAMGHAKKNYSNTMLAEPYLDTLTGYFTFAGSQIISAVADITGTNTNCTFIAGPHSGQSMGLKGSGITSGVTLSTKACPMGARTIRFRLYMSANTAQTLLDETNLSASNYGTCITVDASRKVRFRVMQGGTAVVDITTTTAATLNAWTDVCFAWDGTTGVDRVRAYINGSPAGKGKATAAPNMGQVPTNNTVLLNQAPLANSGGTAAISELEIWNEARYQDALVLEQKGFSLFDGATVRIYPDFLPVDGTEILLNINEQGNVPVETAALASGQWNQLTYKVSSKSFLGTLGGLGRLDDAMLMDTFKKYGTVTDAVNIYDSGSKGTESVGGQNSNSYPWCMYGTKPYKTVEGYIRFTDYTIAQLPNSSSTKTLLQNNYFVTYWGNSSKPSANVFTQRQMYQATSASSVSTSSGYVQITECKRYYVYAHEKLTVSGIVNGKDSTPGVPSGIAFSPFSGRTFTRIATGSYVGTGTNGAKSITVGLDAQLVIFTAVLLSDQTSLWSGYETPIIFPYVLPSAEYARYVFNNSSCYGRFSNGLLSIRGSEDSTVSPINYKQYEYTWIALG